jgi:hypothetical protein
MIIIVLSAEHLKTKSTDVGRLVFSPKTAQYLHSDSEDACLARLLVVMLASLSAAARLCPGASHRSASLSLVSLPLLEDSDEESDEEDSLLDSSSSLDPRFPAAAFLAAAVAAAFFALRSRVNTCTTHKLHCECYMQLVIASIDAWCHLQLVSGVGHFPLPNPSRPLY